MLPSRALLVSYRLRYVGFAIRLELVSLRGLGSVEPYWTGLTYNRLDSAGKGLARLERTRLS